MMMLPLFLLKTTNNGALERTLEIWVISKNQFLQFLGPFTQQARLDTTDSIGLKTHLHANPTKKMNGNDDRKQNYPFSLTQIIGATSTTVLRCVSIMYHSAQ